MPYTVLGYYSGGKKYAVEGRHGAERTGIHTGIKALLRCGVTLLFSNPVHLPC
jgi:hypothetical protein